MGYFQVLLELLLKITQKRKTNLMGLSNVSMIMAPNLFLSPSSRSKTKGILEMEISMATGTSNIVMMLIKYQDILWTVRVTVLLTSATLSIILLWKLDPKSLFSHIWNFLLIHAHVDADCRTFFGHEKHISNIFSWIVQVFFL